MRISDEERREVAARLRANHRRDRETQGTFIARMVKGSDTVTASYICRLPERLADLIDRPTCRNIADFEKESFRCSRCGCRVLATGSTPDGVLVVTSEAFPVDWYSCPVCGAEVVEDD